METKTATPIKIRHFNSADDYRKNFVIPEQISKRSEERRVGKEC